MADWWGANVYVDFAWGDAPLTADASCTWVDETAYVRRVSTRRGRTSELSPVSPGTMTVSLDNSTRRYDASHTAGPRYGQLLPMTKVRFRAGAGSTLVVFSGFVLGWPISYPGMVDSVVQVQCVDAMRVLEQSATPGSAYGAAVLADSPDYYWPMQELDGAGLVAPAVGNESLAPTRHARGAPEVAPTVVPTGEPSSLMDGGGSIGWSSSSTPLTIEAWVHSPGAGGDDQVVMSVFTPDDLTWFNLTAKAESLSVNYSSSSLSRRTPASTPVPWPSKSGSSFHLAVTVVPASAAYVYVDGVLFATVATEAGDRTSGNDSYAVFSIGGSIPDPTVASIAHVALYSSALSAAQVLAHYQAGTIAHGHPMGERTGERIGRILDAVGWPSADRDLSTGSTVCGQWQPDGDSALAQIRSLEELEQGLFFIAADGRATFRSRNWFHVNSRAITPRYTYGDGGGSEIPYGDIEIDGNHLEHIRNTVTASYPGSSVTTKDATSRAAYGIQADSVDGSQLPTTGGWLARQLANYRLRARKDPATRIPTLEIDPRGAGVLSTTLPAVVDLDLGDRVRVIRRPNGSTDPIQVDCNVQGIAHTVDPGTWRTTLYLAPAVKSYTEANYLLIGDATYGVVGDGHLTSY